MSLAQTGAGREPHDLSHLIFSMGKIGSLQTLSVVPVIGGDSISQNFVGSFKMSPLRRGMVLDSVVDVFSFYIPHRYMYGNDIWEEFLKQGVNAELLPSGTGVGSEDGFKLNHLAINVPPGFSGTRTYSLPKWHEDGYASIWNNYFKYPWDDDYDPLWASMSSDEGNYGFRCAHLKSIWNTPLPPERGGREINMDVNGGEATLNIQDLNQAYGSLHTEQERELYAQRFRDVVKSLGGSTHADADQRPRLLNRTTQWASGYDVDGTSEVSLGQYTGRVSQSINHRVPRYYIPEHGAVWTVVLCRFPPVHRMEANYLDRKASPSYADIVGDPSVVGNHPTVEMKVGDFFNENSTEADRVIGKWAHSQWYRYHCPTVHGKFVQLQGFPFIDNLTFGSGSGDLATPAYIDPDLYNDVYQTSQQAHWQIQGKNNFTAMRRLPTTRDSIITSS